MKKELINIIIKINDYIYLSNFYCDVMDINLKKEKINIFILMIFSYNLIILI